MQLETTERKAGVCLVCARSNLAQLVANAPVKFPSLYAQEVISRMYDATFRGDGSGSVDVVACHHTHGDSSPLALPDGFWHLLGKVLRSQCGRLFRPFIFWLLMSSMKCLKAGLIRELLLTDSQEWM